MVAVRCPNCRCENTVTAKYCSNCAAALTGTTRTPRTRSRPVEESPSLLPPGTVLSGRYAILGKIGKGGKGEVHRALDRSLGREVAVKILPDAFAADEECLARFEREARLLAALNHPHIATIHGLERSNGQEFIVMEFVAGETLKARLSRGTPAIAESLELCRQVAEGLAAAHDKGIIHRDLKPANIMITPEEAVKILDFGLAKACPHEQPGVDMDDVTTITARLGEPGVILGTAAYMSPEQARGLPLDTRTDIWSFGCVLYECLTGIRAFQGPTISDTLAQVLQGEPDWTALPAHTPPNIATLLRRCLEKTPRNRLRDIGDARLEIAEPAVGSVPTIPGRRVPALPWLAAGAAAVFLAGVFLGRPLPRPPAAGQASPLITSTITVEPGYRLYDFAGIATDFERPSRTALAISSDGRFVVYSAAREHSGEPVRPQLYLRRMDRSEAAPIAGTEGGINPFLSPDDRQVGFWADGELKRVPIEGGVATVLCEAPSLCGASWGRTNTVVFSSDQDAGLSRVSAHGGEPETLTRPDPEREEAAHRLPAWLPDGKGILFTVFTHLWDQRPRLALLRTDTLEWTVLIEDAADARYVPTGHIVFLRRGTIMAVRFDAVRQKVMGRPAPVVEDVMQAFAVSGGSNTGAGQYSISGAGALIYATGGIPRELENSLVWVAMNGIEEPVTDIRQPYHAPRLSPDGKKVAYQRLGRESQIWVYDLEKGTNNRLTDDRRANYPVWSADGRYLLHGRMKSTSYNLFHQPYDGSAPAERLTTSDHGHYPGSWSSGGDTVVFVEAQGASHDLHLLDLPSRRVTPFLNSPFNERYPDFSPDGRWIAYSSDESGREEVYVRPFPGPGTKHPVSAEGGAEPAWARDGKRLFYRWQDQMWAVDVRTQGGFSAGRPRLLFVRRGDFITNPVRGYDISLDSQRFLVVKLEQRAPARVTELTLVQSWFGELQRLLPNRP